MTIIFSYSSLVIALKVYNHGCVYIFHGQMNLYLRLLTGVETNANMLLASRASEVKKSPALVGIH